MICDIIYFRVCLSSDEEVIVTTENMFDSLGEDFNGIEKINRMTVVVLLDLHLLRLILSIII